MRDKIRAAIAANDLGADGLGGDLTPGEIDRLTDAVVAALSAPPADDVREALGRRVREVWIEWALEQPNLKPSWFVPWEGLGEADREVDMRIGETIAAEVRPRGTVTDAERYAAALRAIADGDGPVFMREFARDALRPLGTVTGAGHDRNHMMICRNCGEGITALDVVDGEKPCPGPRGTVES